MPDQKLDIRWSDWLPSGVALRALLPGREHACLKETLLDRLASGAVRSVCTSSVHTYGATTSTTSRIAAIPPGEWRHYQARDSSLEWGDVRMEWTSRVALPILGLCRIVTHYVGVHLSLDDLIREFPEAPWSRGRVSRSAEPLASPAARPAARHPNTVIDLAGTPPSDSIAIRKRSALH